MSQLTLGIDLRDDATFTNFFAGQNKQVLQYLQRNSERYIFLWGDPGAGVTHLLQACCHDAFNQQHSAIYLSLSEPDLAPEVLQDLENIDVVCIDNIESIIGKQNWEESLLHLYNRIRDTETRLIIGAKQLPKGLRFNLLDLKSRLAWGLILKVHALSDEEKIEALALRAKRRGFSLAENTRQFLLRCYPDNITALFEALEKLDKASLTEKRKITIPFIRKILSKH